MPVAIADAFRNINVFQNPNTTTVSADRVGDTLTLTAGFGISISADPNTDNIIITNSGNGTGALTTITDVNSNSTFYPIFTRAPIGTDINPNSGTYQMDTMYLDQTTTPMTYNPSTGILTAVKFSGNLAATTSTITTNEFVGSAANLTRFPSAIVSISNNGSGVSETTTNIGLIAEGLGVNTGNYGVGIYGVGYSSGNARGTGVTGEGHVTATGDTASAIGVRGYSNDTHAGGLNVGLFADASGSGTGNYALWMQAGNINSAAAQTWTLLDNNASALSIDATGKAGILLIKTTDAAEGVTMSGTLAVTGHVTLEGVTSTGATGTNKLVFDTSPTLVTPVLGVATATSINKMAITAPATSSTLAVADGKTFTVNNSITLAGTDSTTITLPSTTGTVALNNQTHFIGTTSIAINRASAAQSLTGITSIDGYAAGITGGAIGYIPYQSAANTTLFVTGNTTTTPQFLTSTGTGSAAQAPTLTSSTGSGNVVLATSPSLTTPTLGVATATSINKLAITAPATGSTLAVADGKTFTVNNTITLAGTDSTTITLPSTTGTVALNNQTLYIGTTSIAINRSSASQSLTGITSIDGYAAGVAGGTLGSILYQTGANTTSSLTGNAGNTPQFVTSTGSGGLAQAPTLTSSTGTGNVVLSTNPTITAPTSASATSTNDTDFTFDASTNEYFSYIQSASGTARTINVSNLSAGRRAVLYLRNTNAATKVINIAASVNTTGYAGVNLSKGDAGGTSVTAVTLAATSGTATVTVFNASGVIGGFIS